MRLLVIDDEEVAHEVLNPAKLDEIYLMCQDGWSNRQDAEIEFLGTSVLHVMSEVTGRPLFGVQG